MYDGWKTQRWDTPLSGAKSVGLVQFVQSGATLEITLEDMNSSGRPRWLVRFASCPIYQNILEEFRLGLWETVSEQFPDGAPIGATRLIDNSPWISQLCDSEPLLSVHYPGLLHFQIVTEDDVFDILSEEYADIRELGPAPSDAPRPGRSEVLYAPQDADRIGEIIDQTVKQVNRDAVQEPD